MAEAAPTPATVSIQRSATFALVALNLIVYIHEAQLTSDMQYGFGRQFALSLDGIRAGAWWQFLTYQFLHGGFAHLILNVLFLDSIGPVLETTLGRWRFLVLYLVSGALGGLVQLLGGALSQKFFGHPVVGASAGLCGLLAALGAIYAEDRIQVRILFIIPVTLKAKFLLLAAGLISIAGVIFPLGNVAHLAHLGGLVGGLLCVNWLKPQQLLEIGDEPTAPPRLPVNRA